MGPNLSQYFERIGYNGPAEPTRAALFAVHRRHLLSIAYENIDVALARPVDHSIEAVFEKMVVRGRGGWCYENNGLLGWALDEMGFEVTRLVGGVMREMRGDEAFGNHLVLRVDCDGPWIADAGLGDAILEPIPLAEGTNDHAGRSYRLEKLDGAEWRFHNRTGAAPPSSDLIDAPADEARLKSVGDELQQDPESMFRQNLICQLMTEDGAHVLIGRVLTNTGPDGGAKRLLDSEAELLETLKDPLRINPPDITGLWDHVVARHQELFGDTPAEEITFGP